MSLRDELGHDEYARLVRVWGDYCDTQRGWVFGRTARLCRRRREGKW